MKSNYSAIVWDMDGALIDSESIHAATLESACKIFGLKVLPHHHHVGQCMTQIWSAIGGPEQSKISQEGWLQYLHLEFMKKTKSNKDYLRPGIEIVLNQLSTFKLPQACATNSPREALDFNMMNL